MIQTEQNIEDSHSNNPFGRGAMKFDDYNYAVSNPYILLGENKNEKNYLRIKGGYSDG